MRPRILLVTRNLPPLLGGMEKLNQRMASGLREWADITIVGPVGCVPYVAPAEVREVTPKPLWHFVAHAAAAAWVSARCLRPHLVLAGSGLTAPMARIAARGVGARMAVYVHGLDVIAPHAAYRALWLPAIRAADTIVANSRNTRALAIARGVPQCRIGVVHPGTDLRVPRPEGRARFRARHGLGEAPVLLSVGRLTARKGLAAFVAESLPAILAARPDTVLAVIGDEAPDALHRIGGGSAELLAAAASAGVTGAVRLLGPCSDHDLEDAYSGSDVHVFPVCDVPGDVEGFGMVAIEAAAHGLATVAFDVGGVGDAVTPDTGLLLEPRDGAGMAAAVLRYLDGYDRARCRTGAAAFGWSRFDEAMRIALEPLCRPR